MDIFREDSPSISKLPDAKAAIFDHLNQIKQWQESLRQRIKAKQLTEQEKFLQHTKKQEENIIQLLENKKGIMKKPVPENNLENKLEVSINSIDESSLSGHLMRCFSDSSRENSFLFKSKDDECSKPPDILNGNCNSSSTVAFQSNSETDLPLKNDERSTCKKPKRPYLKKGSGLLKYMPKRKANSAGNTKTIDSQENPPDSTTTSKLKPALIQRKQQAKKMNHVQFLEPIIYTQSNKSSADSESKDSIVIDKDLIEVASSESSSSIPMAFNREPVYSDTSLDVSLTKETKELAEFEMLENCAQNSSFNSDCSIVQRVINGGPVEILEQEVRRSEGMDTNKNYFKKPQSGASTNFLGKEFSKCIDDVRNRKKQLQDLMLGINPRIAALQKEITGSTDSPFQVEVTDNIRCGYPVNVQSYSHIEEPPQITENVLSGNNSDSDSSQNSVVCVTKEAPGDGLCNDHQDLYENEPDPDLNDFDAKVNHDMPSEIGNVDETSTLKSKLREKVEQLEKEITIYQEHNKHLETTRKERDEIVKKLQKEKEDMQKYKQDELKKFKEEIEKERQQLKREKETFNRYQKLRRDNPGKKEREELSALRQEVEKLKEELKRQKIKFTSDMRRMKNQLIAADKERDTVKLENITLEEQCHDLLTALKARTTKKKKKQIIEDEDNIEPDIINTVDDNDNHSKNTTKSTKPSSKTTKSKSTKKSVSFSQQKARVHFNLSPSHSEEILNRELEIETEMYREMHSQECEVTDLFLKEKDGVEMEKEPLYEEIIHGDKIERLYLTGEREIIFTSGTTKHVSADGLTVKILFHNGDVKETFPDAREVYRYDSGVVETTFSDGLQTTEFPDGQVQRKYPDGLKEVSFPDGTTHCIHPNGTEEITTADGTVVKLEEDGTETVQFVNGEREIRTATYKRREYPDGSVKILYDSGRQETRYSNGRIRIKDKDGKLVVDTKHLKTLARS